MALPKARRTARIVIEDEDDAFNELMRGQGHISLGEEIIDGVLVWLRTTRGIRIVGGQPVAAEPKAAAQPKAQKRTRRGKDPKWVQAALPGIVDVSFGVAANGKVPVSINAAKAFPLTSSPADILAVLVEVEDADKDGFAAPRFARELVPAYSARRGRPETEHAVVVALGRLRHQLEMIGNVSPELVETVPGRGVRLRIRRDKP